MSITKMPTLLISGILLIASQTLGEENRLFLESDSIDYYELEIQSSIRQERGDRTDSLRENYAHYLESHAMDSFQVAVVDEESRWPSGLQSKWIFYFILLLIAGVLLGISAYRIWKEKYGGFSADLLQSIEESENKEWKRTTQPTNLFHSLDETIGEPGEGLPAKYFPPPKPSSDLPSVFPVPDSLEVTTGVNSETVVLQLQNKLLPQEMKSAIMRYAKRGSTVSEISRVLNLNPDEVEDIVRHEMLGK